MSKVAEPRSLDLIFFAINQTIFVTAFHRDGPAESLFSPVLTLRGLTLGGLTFEGLTPGGLTSGDLTSQASPSQVARGGRGAA